MRKFTAEKQEGCLFALVLMIGALLMLSAGSFALQMPRTWQINNTNMDSKLNPNEVYAIYRKDYDVRLAPIRTDIPDLLATGAVPNQGSFLPPSAVEFKAVGQIATTTPFVIGTPALASTATPWFATSDATVLATASQPTIPVVAMVPTATQLPSATLIPTQIPWPTNTPRRTATRTRTPVPTGTDVPPATATPTDTLTPVPPTSTSVVLPSATPTRTTAPTNPPVNTVTSAPTRTATATATRTATRTFTPAPSHTPTPTPTVTATNTPTPTDTPTDLPVTGCDITGSTTITVPEGGCTVTYTTSAQGGIFTLEMTGSGNLSVSWHGLLENQTSGSCTAQNRNLTPGQSLSNIAVANSGGIAIPIVNSNGKSISVQITVSDWLVGGCQ